MNDRITQLLNQDPLILQALREDISSEDVTTNAILRTACPGQAELICKQDGVIAGLPVFERTFHLLHSIVKTVTPLAKVKNWRCCKAICGCCSPVNAPRSIICSA